MNVPEDLKYTKDHEWVRVEGGEVVVGITDYAQSELGDVVFVELPAVGATVAEAASFGSIEAVKAVSDLYAPLAGEIVAVNEEVPQNPALLNQSPHEKGWLFRLSPSDPKEAESLMDYGKYQEFLKASSS